MLSKLRAWLVLEDENMPTELKLGNLDRLDGMKP